MGVIHKLRPEIITFIIEQKKNNPSLSCRGLSDLLDIKFKVQVSKSSVNDIVKQAGLSQPVGRRISKNPQTLKERIHLALSPQTEPPVVEKKDIAQDEEARLNLEQERNRILEEEKAAEAQKVLQEKKKLEDEINAAQEAKKLQEEERLRQEEASKKEATEKKRIEEERLRKEQEQLSAEKEKAEKAKEDAEKRAEEERLAKEKEAAVLAGKNFILEPALVLEEKERDCSGLILLKAVDYLLGGSRKFNDLIGKYPGGLDKEAAVINEGLIYNSLINEGKLDFNSLGALLGTDITEDKTGNYLAGIQGPKALESDIFTAIEDIFKEIRCLKIIFSDGTFFYLDADFYTTWSTQYTPYDFSICAAKVNNDLNKYFLDTHPLVLFMAPGYEFPTKEFMILVLNFNSEKNIPQNVIFYDNKLTEVFTTRLEVKKTKHQLIFGLWPWQFAGTRTVKKLGKFSSYHLHKSDAIMLLADIQIELMHPESKQKVLLNGCALKSSPAEQTQLVILTNSREGTFKPEEIADTYIYTWPNREEAFQDYSRKVELFTYAADSQKLFSLNMPDKDVVKDLDIKGIFAIYLKLLDGYLKWHFLPAGYEDKDFETTKSRFYDLTAHISPKANSTAVKFTIPSGYAYSRDLEYLCRRLNEKGVEFYPGKRVFFSL